uniref:glycerol-3-phosphate dehydrogenase [NAD(+)], cytoplasmic-like n=1 Tax=Styela clava TaxID=7725 RepID=UPI00193A3E07|nr:glycerol-3-phosphate dehydrogenase [NAD(+)], cytoplasmic-like [Styela clava]
MTSPKKICIVGSGNWGSAISKIIGKNAAESGEFHDTVNMYVYEEMIEGRKLTEIINNDHENVKYLPGHKLPENVVAVPDLMEAGKDADIFIFVVPHQFIKRLCDQLKGQIKKDAIGISLIKGVDHSEKGLRLISSIIHESLGIDISVLMGANIAREVADSMFCETTVGCRCSKNGQIFKNLLQTPNFRICVVEDLETVEICGALKNIVACGAGFVDGLGLGDNTKAAVIRLGLMEMMTFSRAFFADIKPQTSTFLESCGVADLVTTCYGGRNRKVSEAFVKTKKSIEELEKEMLNGQKLQGPQTASEVIAFLLMKDLDPNAYPLFYSVYRICFENMPASEFITCLQNHPEHM